MFTKLYYYLQNVVFSYNKVLWSELWVIVEKGNNQDFSFLFFFNSYHFPQDPSTLAYPESDAVRKLKPLLP
jgi:hypothetical protein